MKIKAVHFETMKNAIEPFDTVENRARYLPDQNRRYRWDLLYAANLSQWICDNLYSYLDDDHIDTALRSIVK